MGNSSDLRPLHLNEIAIPGTHNSGTRDFPGIGAAYSICQTADVRQQLDAGIRYLDFRVCDDVEGKNGELWVSHTYVDAGQHFLMYSNIIDSKPVLLNRTCTRSRNF